MMSSKSNSSSSSHLVESSVPAAFGLCWNLASGSVGLGTTVFCARVSFAVATGTEVAVGSVNTARTLVLSTGCAAFVVGAEVLAVEDDHVHKPHILGQFFRTTAASHSRTSKALPHSTCSGSPSQVRRICGVSVVVTLLAVVMVVVDGMHTLHMTGQ